MLSCDGDTRISGVLGIDLGCDDDGHNLDTVEGVLVRSRMGSIERRYLAGVSTALVHLLRTMSDSSCNFVNEVILHVNHRGVVRRDRLSPFIHLHAGQEREYMLLI